MQPGGKFSLLKELFITVGAFGGRGAGTVIAIFILAIGGFIYGFFTLQFEIVAISILGFAFTSIVSFLCYKLMNMHRLVRLEKYTNFIDDLNGYKPYEKLYLFEIPRQYENIEEDEYLPKLKNQMLLGFNVEIKYIESSNNVVLNVYGSKVPPKLEGLYYVS